MTITEQRAVNSEVSMLPGATIIARIRRLLWVSIVAGVVYSSLVRASKSGCPGGVDGSGGYLDANGNPTQIPPECVSLTLGPSPLVVLFIGMAVIWSLGRVLRRAGDEPVALRILDRSAVAIILIVATSVVVAQIWFALIPLYGINGSGTYVWPFPFGSVDMQTMPMTAGD